MDQKPPLDQDKRPYIATVSQARQTVAGVNLRITDASRAQYNKDYIRMMQRNLLPETMGLVDRLGRKTDTPIGTKNSYYKYRAAWCHHCTREIRELLASADRLQKANDLRWVDEVKRIQGALAELMKYPPDPEFKKARAQVGSEDAPAGAWALEVARRNSIAPFKPKVGSKKSSIRGMTPNWQEELFHIANEEYKTIVAVLSISGARPAELEQGILLESTELGLVCSIHTAKTREEKSGDAMRRFTIDPTGLFVEHLMKSICREEGHIVIRKSSQAARKRLSELGKQAFPRKRNSISAYSLRHQFSANLKATSLTSEQISAALGHASDETKRYYSSRHLASSNTAARVIAVDVIRPVRMKSVMKLETMKLKLEEGAGMKPV